MADLEKFRAETRAWLEENCPPDMRKPMRGEEDICWGGKRWKFQSEAQKIWLERMAARGWTVPTWPKEYGGGGLSKEEAKILKEEMRRIKARSPLESFGIWMLGPALLEYGAHEQKAHFLPPIARGEIRWCQGYSEPNAGSDLASLQCRCEDRGDHWLVNGQKIWTSYADESDWIFVLVRTDREAPKHLGISFILIDMESPGVTTRPIRLISGKSPFCETFFDDVKVPKEHAPGVSAVVGELNRGWDVAKYLLTHEREMIGAGGSGAIGGAASPGEVAARLVGVDETGRLADPILRGRIAEAEIDGWAFLLTMERLKDEAKAGKGMGAKSSMLKYYGTEFNKRRYELMMDAAGSDGLEWEGERSEDGKLARSWLRTKANSIEGGTSEVQLNIIAKRILELPDA
ncbi:acyl-CoA dehydrogenase family protein [Amphiplicatus metriothermophilus]|uniref:Acyl-CoA dehydrogenase n=1 Tax=Amphiplicatus metriothermophilus TaxID=1519374 RepID=A0A239PK78_9PROT|nr:acyl-CoA dehydrogenase family protein [Amphiplicatus metriothermophilus]MBB5517444.1 acyl-CoA dehydrogenase [Amphiplicatus metriothermophilus]SNT68221.1 acyl-CoA dehydrogenase [Amphiplicatus metriothermophilus]